MASRQTVMPLMPAWAYASAALSSGSGFVVIVWTHSRSRLVSGAALSCGDAWLVGFGGLPTGLNGGPLLYRNRLLVKAACPSPRPANPRGRSTGSGACGAHRSARSRVGLGRLPAAGASAGRYRGYHCARRADLSTLEWIASGPPLRLTAVGDFQPQPALPPSPTAASRSMAERIGTRELRSCRRSRAGARRLHSDSHQELGARLGKGRSGVWWRGGLGGLGEAATPQTATARLGRGNQELNGLRAEPGSSPAATSTCAGAGRRPALRHYTRCDGRRRRPSHAVTQPRDAVPR
jgi:hypothetical protein